MAISKVYERTYYVNGKNGGTPLNGASSREQAISQAIGNMNKIDYALDEIDQRVVDIANSRFDSQDYALQSQSYATGDAYLDDSKTVPYRPGQEKDCAKYYYEQAKEKVDNATFEINFEDGCLYYLSE